jgi:glycosyltransferase involved in cell wall biosynthesis
MKVLIVFPEVSGKTPSFIQKDIDILSSDHEVRVVVFERLRKNFYQLLKGAIWADISFSWFAALHASVVVVLSRILGKKSIVIAGGYDVASVPELNYGQTLDFSGRLRAVITMKLANLVLSVSDFTREESIENALCNPKKIKTVYHGFKTFVTPDNMQKDEKLVLTVSFLTMEQMKRKGILTFVECAKYLPEYDLVVVGAPLSDSKEFLQKIKSPNVRVTGYLPQNKLEELLKRAKVYVQVSIHEGFGCSLAEAMLYECVPVVTKKGAIPEVVGNTGFYVPLNDPESTAQAIRKASHSYLGPKARERILNKFPLEKRKKLILEAINSLSR